MLAPFGPHLTVEEGLKNSFSHLAPPCMLKGTSAAVQIVEKPVNAHIRPDNDDGLITDGSHVILYSTRDNVQSLIVKRNATFDTRHGHFWHNDLIGKPYGSRIYARKAGKGWLCALRPTSELWTLGCNHRTEILYLSDISMILANLGVKPGSIVIETGTGTGSLSTAFITALQPTGRLYTFEYHDMRAKGAAADFDRNGLSPWVTVTHRDTIGTGFPSELDGKADAVFLDLPAPWEVVAPAKKALKHEGVFCSFSPCMEQIQATAEKLAELGYTNIETIECLQKAYDVRNITVEQNWSDWDIESSQNPFPSSVVHNPKKRAREIANEQESGASSSTGAEVQDASTSKRPSPPENTATSSSSGPSRPLTIRSARFAPKNADPSLFRLSVRPYPEMRGHTGYLIFARNYLLPRITISREATPAPHESSSST